MSRARDKANSTVSNFASTGIDDNADATAITIDQSERVMIGTTTEGDASADDLTVAGSANTGITIRAGTSNSSSIYMSDATSGAGEYAGYIAYSHSSDSMGFGASGGQRIRVDSDGLKFGGDTAAANALDDYEFGDYDITLTPSSSGSITPSSGENKASYVKIGNFVQAQGRVTVSSVSSPAGDLAINLPFTTTSSQGEASGSGAPALFVWNSTQTNNGLWVGFFDKSISAFYIRWGNSSTPGHSASYIQASTEIRFSVSYITDS